MIVYAKSRLNVSPFDASNVSPYLKWKIPPMNTCAVFEMLGAKPLIYVPLNGRSYNETKI